MSGAVVLVTGALNAIGTATASAFAQRGDVVVVSGRHDDSGVRLARDLRDVGAADALFVHADVRFERDVAELVGLTVNRFGRVDVAVNNAGSEGKGDLIVESTALRYAATFGTNVLATLLSMKHELRVMQQQGSGTIINIASVFCDSGAPSSALDVASNHAIIGLTQTAASEAVPYGVRVNAVGPRCIDTATFRWAAASPGNQAAGAGRVSNGRSGDWEEVSDAVIFLACRESTYPTGQTLFLG
jgi:NAD(P)-dependent dehydrogenase (short-subunit alcohol dehydrogenase family)